MKALVGAFNQEKALVGAFSVIVKPVVEPMDRFAALITIYRRNNGQSVNQSLETSQLFSVFDSSGQQQYGTIWTLDSCRQQSSNLLTTTLDNSLTTSYDVRDLTSL